MKRARSKKILIPLFSLLFLLSFTIFSTILFSTLLVSNAYASTKSVALVVKDKNSLSEVHEKKIYWILKDLGLDLTLVDKSVSVNYNNFDLIVVAGRPLISEKYQLDSFVANIPVNEVPTIGIDFGYLDDWGWARQSGVSSSIGSKRQNIYITKEHPLTWRFFLGEDAYVHTVQGYTIIDIIGGYTNLQSVASTSTIEKYGVIRYGSPNTQLYDGKKISDHSAVVFFGITYPIYWTNEAEQLFENAVIWLTEDTDGDGLKDYMDNCVYDKNPDQADIDSDGLGDACDPTDDRPDVAVIAIDLPAERIECEDLKIKVEIKNLGSGDSTGSTLSLEVGGGIYEKPVGELSVGQSKIMEFSIPGSNLCGISKDMTAYVSNIQPSDKDSSNDELAAELIFTTVKMDVDADGTLEKAKDQNADITNGVSNGYESYSDPNGNSDVASLDGDPDGKADYLIDIGENGVFEKYWDPDDRVLTDVFYRVDDNGDKTDLIEIDLDGDGDVDALYNLTSGSVEYMDKTSPAIGAIMVSPSFGSGASTWYIFSISASVADSESKIDEDSCEYTVDGTRWYGALYAGGSCYKNGLRGTIGQTLSINMRVRDTVGNLATGQSVARTVSIRPLDVTITADKSSYSPNESVHVSGYVSYADSGEKVGSATIRYSFGSTTGSAITAVSGSYGFDLIAPNSYGTYTLSVNAIHTYSEGAKSTELSVPAPATTTTITTTTQSQSSSIGLPSIAMLVYAPKSLSAYDGEDKQFVVTVSNIGSSTLHYVKVNVDSDIQFETGPGVQPDMVDLTTGKSKDFTVTLHIPKGAAGEHDVDIDVLSFETSTLRTLNLTVLEKKVPIVEVIGISVPELYANESAVVNITLKNIGNGDAFVTEAVQLPTGWQVETSTITAGIAPMSEKTISFIVTPSDASGSVDFTTSYSSDGEELSLTNSTNAVVKKREPEQAEQTQGAETQLIPKQPITGMLFAVISDPRFYIVALIVFAPLMFVIYKKFFETSTGKKTALTL